MRTFLCLGLAACLLACGDDGEETEAPPPPPDVKAFMENYFVVFDSYDKNAIVALYDPAVTADISGLGMLSGFEEVRAEWLDPFTSAFPDYTHTVNSITVEGQHATADFVFRGTHQAELLGNPPTGKELVLPIIGNYDVADNEVVNFTLEYDVAIVVAAITP
ncbi:MAG TPA: nuclear transport factor 2 family protein [Polyangiaceae bacterium]|jgi:predicted ester cyclase|nr:nuclear transport factor 2 family protein [Polyangiaceae bacterium]